MGSVIMDGWLGLIIAAFALVGSPGLATLSFAATGATFGFRSGIGYLIGIETAMILIMVVVATGLMGIIMSIPKAAPTFKRGVFLSLVNPKAYASLASFW